MSLATMPSAPPTIDRTMSDLVPYRPYPLLRSGHLQTLMIGLLSGPRGSYNAKPHRVGLADGEAMLAHEELSTAGQADDLPESAPLAILIHGLGGDHTSPYLERIAKSLRQRGVRPWRLDLRGSGRGMELAWRPAHAGCSQDLASVVQAAHELYPLAPIHIAGFSLSGNILLKMLGEAAAGILPASFPLAAINSAIAVAPPVDLHACAQNLERRSRRIYSRYYLKVLEQQVVLRSERWEQWRAEALKPRMRSIREFDARFTAPLAGFRDTDHYYSSSSSLPWLNRIITPTTIVIDRHDPIVTYYPLGKEELHPESTRLITTDFGGHMGYFGMDNRGKLIRWMEHFVVRELDPTGSQ